jgi:hypothetical protein
VIIATTNRCANTILIPSRPSEESASASSSTTTGPRLHATCVEPTSFPRAFAGENSPTSASEVGTSAPTATAMTTVPANSITGLAAKTMQTMPAA